MPDNQFLDALALYLKAREASEPDTNVEERAKATMDALSRLIDDRVALKTQDHLKGSDMSNKLLGL